MSSSERLLKKKKKKTITKTHTYFMYIPVRKNMRERGGKKSIVYKYSIQYTERDWTTDYEQSRSSLRIIYMTSCIINGR